jgi:hypothetical protein
VVTIVDKGTLGILRGLQGNLLQPVNGMHQSLKLGTVNQIESAFFAREHFERDAPRGRNHTGSLFWREITRGDRIKRKTYQDAQAPDATALLIDFSLRRLKRRITLSGFHVWPVAIFDYYELGPRARASERPEDGSGKNSR